MDMQFGDDGAFYLLTYGDGFFNVNPDAGVYKWSYVKGQRAPKVVIVTNRTDGPAPLTVNFSSEGSLDEDPADSISLRVGLRGNGTPSSIEPEPDAHLQPATVVTPRRLTVFDSCGQQTSTSTAITVGNTARRSPSASPWRAGRSPSAIRSRSRSR